MNDAQYYMRVRGRVQGPFDQEKLKSLGRRGQLSRLHEVSTDGINWARASTFPELFVSPPSEETAGSQPSATGPNTPAPSTPGPNPAVPPMAGATGAAFGDGLAMGRAEWWYSLQGKEQGPFEFAVLQQMAAGGQLGRHQFVWKSGMTGWREAVEIPGLSFGDASPRQSHSQPTGTVASGTAVYGTATELTPLDPATPEESLYRTALRLRPKVLLLAITICLAAGACCLWSLWQFFGPSQREARTVWSLLLGALGLIESGILAALAILLSVHAGRLAGLRHSPQPVVLEKALGALRQFWILAAIALLLGLVLAGLFLAMLATQQPAATGVV